jgi:hypothetical protein
LKEELCRLRGVVKTLQRLLTGQSSFGKIMLLELESKRKVCGNDLSLYLETKTNPSTRSFKTSGMIKTYMPMRNKRPLIWGAEKKVLYAEKTFVKKARGKTNWNCVGWSLDRPA